MVTKLKMRRIELDLKQKDVAAQAHITPQYLRYLETGRAKNPSIEVMKNIAKVLDASEQDLFF